MHARTFYNLEMNKRLKAKMENSLTTISQSNGGSWCSAQLWSQGTLHLGRQMEAQNCSPIWE